MSHILFKKNVLTTALTIATATTAQASIVSDGIDYQYFRDFAENKGKFTVGATQIDVTDKAGVTKQMFPDGQASMLDLAVTSTNGVAHLIDPQYIASVKHNVGYGNVHFGLQRSSNFAEPNYDYLLVARNDKPNSGENGNWTMKDDYHIPRLHKLVTEVAPIPILRLKHEELRVLADRTRFPYIVRTGAGTQRVRPLDGSEDKDVAGAYNYVLGGNIMNNVIVQTGNNNRVFYIYEDRLDKTVTDSQYGPLPTISMGGDSGSPVFAYDAQEKQWVAISVHHGGNRSSRNWTIFHQPEFIDELIAKDIVVIDNTITDPNVRLNWLVNTNTSTITSTHDRELRHTVNLRDETLAKPDETRFRDDLNHGKSIRITGNQGNLRLGGDVHQGAGALYFDTDFTVFGARDDLTWVGAGVSVADGKTVNWRVHNPEGDRLSKIGAGTLNVTGVGVNKGKISVGEGTVLLNQKANAQGEKQAFSEVQITSGRPTVVLGDDKQVNPDNIVFGFRGGRLDVNGNDLTFTRLRSVDSGAKIVNHNPNDGAVVTFNQSLAGSEPISPNDVAIETDRSSTYKPKGIYKNGPYRDDGRTDYYILKDGANPSTFLPGKGQDNSAWEFISTDENEAKRIFAERENARRKAGQIAFFEGQLGETDTQRHNGNLDFVYNPQNQVGRLVLNGGTNLNGTLSVAGGTLILSGNPVPHAYDYLNKTDVVKDDEWVNSNFTAKNFNITNGTLLTSRNVDTITGNINVSQTGQAHLGFANGETDVCYRSDFSGVAHCSNRAIDNLITPLTVNGDITTRNQAELSALNTTVNGRLDAFDQSTVTLKNNAIISESVGLNNTAKLTFANSEPLAVKVAGTRNSQVVMQAGSHWQLPSNTTIGHLSGEQDSQITLSNEQTKQFQSLTLNGDLSGSVKFNMASDLGAGKADRLVVNGYAEGQHQLAVKNTGNEASVDELTLVELKHGGQEAKDVAFTLQGGFVDAGAWRYTLQNDETNRYYLFNQQKADEIKAQKEAEAKRAKEEADKAKKALADAIKAREDAENALKQALANSGANAQDLINAQKQADEARKLADQANHDKALAEQQLKAVNDELNAMKLALQTAQDDKNQADNALKTAKAEQTRLQTALDNANRATMLAEEQKAEADRQKDEAEAKAKSARQAQAAAEQNLAQALANKDEADQQREQAQKALNDLQTQKTALEEQLTTLQNSQTASNQALTELRNQLGQANEQIAKQEQALKTAEDLKNQAVDAQNRAEADKNNAQTALINAQAQLGEANRAKDEALSRANDATIAKQQVQANLEQVQSQLDQAVTDKNVAEQKLSDTQTALQNAQKIQQDLQNAQDAQAKALQDAQTAQQLAEEARDRAEQEKERQANLARQAQQAQQKAEDAQKLAEDAKKQALADLANAKNAQQQAEQAQKQAEDAQKLAQNARDDAEKALQTALDAKNQAQADQAKAQDDLANALRDKQIAEDALRLAQQNGSQDVVSLKNQLAQANQLIQDKEQALTQVQANVQTAQTAQQLAEEQRDMALATVQTANQAKQQAQDALLDIRTQLAQAQADKQAADLAKQQAEQNLAKLQADKQKADDDLAQAQADKQKTDRDLAQAQSDLTALQTQTTQLQTTLNTANTEKNQAQSDLANALRDKQIAEDALRLAQQNGNQDVAKLAQDLANANAQVAQKTQDLRVAIANQATLQSDLDNKEQALNDIRTQLAQAQADKQAADLAKQQAQEAKQQAQDEANRQAKLAKQAQDAQNVAELNAQNAKNAQKLAQDAQALAEDARLVADQARRDVEEINARLQAHALADQATIAKIQGELVNAQKVLDNRTNALNQAKEQVDSINAQLLVAQNQAKVLQEQLAQEQRLREQVSQAWSDAVIAQNEANQAKLQAIEAQNKSEAEKKLAQDNLAKAEQLASQKVDLANALEKQRDDLAVQLANSLKVQQNLQATLSAQSAQNSALKAQLDEALAKEELAKAEAEAKRKADLAELAKKQAELTKSKKQAEIISQYANTALSEVSATTHHLSRVEQRIDDRLQKLNGKNSGVWLQTDVEKTKHQSDQYRAYTQDSTLTQIGADTTLSQTKNDLVVGMALSQLNYDANYDDGFTGEGQTTTGTAYTKWQTPSGFSLTADVSVGQAKSDIKENAQINASNIKRNVASVGVGMSQTWQAGSVDIQAHTGLKYHHIGDVNYDIHADNGTKAHVKQDDISVTSLNAGINVGKTIQMANGLHVRPSVGVNYRHTDSSAIVHINDQPLTQKFASEVQSQVGVAVGGNHWELDVQLDYADNNETGHHKSGMVGVSWKF